MTTANRHSNIGDTVTIQHPRTRKQVTGIVDWISPSRGTIQVQLPDGNRAYEYPEFDGIYPPQTPRVPWRITVTGLKGTVVKAKQ